jgi:hypothetical protein
MLTRFIWFVLLIVLLTSAPIAQEPKDQGEKAATEKAAEKAESEKKVAKSEVAASEQRSGDKEGGSDGEKKYRSLLDSVLKGDRTISLADLRMAYAQTSAYSPYGSDKESRQKMFGAVREKKFDKVLETAEEILKDNYVDIYAHFGAFVACRETGKTEKAGFHQYLFEGLLKSITTSGDGKSPETAFVVIAVDEEYAVVDFLGLQRGSQALVREKKHTFDLLTVTDSQTKKELKLYFNIDLVFAGYGKMFDEKNK